MKLSVRIVSSAACAVLCLGAFALPAAAGADSDPADTPSASSPSDPVLVQVDEAVKATSRRFLSAESHTPWQIMHGILAFRQAYQLKSNGEKINALQWVSDGPEFKGEEWFEKTRYGGRAHPYTTAYAFEGHPNQFLAILTMSELPVTHTFKAGDEKITIADMISNAKKDVRSNEEITWTLWALSAYLPPDEQWENKFGEQWSMERLVRMQTQADVYRGACGGTHGMFALSRARNAYLKAGRPLRGVWIEADQKIQRYIEEAKSTQNSDGTFSARYFQGRSQSSEFAKRLATSGHVLEFVVTGATESQLRQDWLRRAVGAVANELLTHRRDPAEPGAMYHALDGLIIYRDRLRPPHKNAAVPEAPGDPPPVDGAEEDELPVEQPAGAPSEQLLERRAQSLEPSEKPLDAPAP